MHQLLSILAGNATVNCNLLVKVQIAIALIPLVHIQDTISTRKEVAEWLLDRLRCFN